MDLAFLFQSWKLNAGFYTRVGRWEIEKTRLTDAEEAAKILNAVR
jgi:hypothetical protein